MAKNDESPHLGLNSGRKHLVRLYVTEATTSPSQKGARVPGWLSVTAGRDAAETRLLLNQLDECLELAYRKDIIDSDLRARLLSSKAEEFEAALNELRVARFLEGLGNAIVFHPSGRNGKKLDFKVAGRQSECLVEVKTVFPSQQEKEEDQTLFQLWEAARLKARGPFELNFRDYVVGKDINRKKLGLWLAGKLPDIMQENNDAASIRFVDDETGFSVTVDATRISGPETAQARQRMPTVIVATSGSGEQVWPGYRMAKKIRDAVEQLPDLGIPCLVVIIGPGGYGLFDEELRAVLYGASHASAEWPLPEGAGAVFSQAQNTRLSGVGFYQIGMNRGVIEEELEIYHNNRWAKRRLDTAMFGSRAVIQFSLNTEGLHVTSL